MDMVKMRKRGFTAGAAIAALLTTGLFSTLSAPANAGGLSLSVRVPGLAIHAGPPGVAVAVGQPGFYGEVTVGDLPAPPPVIYATPVVVEGRAVGAPMYLHVPPGYEHHWAEHCAYYHACGRPVYFVREDWYQGVYVPRYRHMEEERREREAHFHEVAREREFAHDHDRDMHHDFDRDHRFDGDRRYDDHRHDGDRHFDGDRRYADDHGYDHYHEGDDHGHRHDEDHGR